MDQYIAEPTDRSYAHIGVSDTHHSISHHGDVAEKIEKYAKIGTYQRSPVAITETREPATRAAAHSVGSARR